MKATIELKKPDLEKALKAYARNELGIDVKEITFNHSLVASDPIGLDERRELTSVTLSYELGKKIEVTLPTHPESFRAEDYYNK